MLSKNIDSQDPEQKSTNVILPEELLLNSLLLFEDELSEEEIPYLQDREDSGDTQPREKICCSDNPDPIITASDSDMDINQAGLELDEQDTETYYQKVKKELAQYIIERQNITEQVRKKLLTKRKSIKQKKKSTFEKFELNSKKYNFSLLSKQKINTKIDTKIDTEINTKTNTKINTNLEMISKERKAINCISINSISTRENNKENNSLDVEKVSYKRRTDNICRHCSSGLFHLKLNIGTSVTKVSGGGLRRSRASHNRSLAAKFESTPKSKCRSPFQFEEAGLIQLDEKHKFNKRNPDISASKPNQPKLNILAGKLHENEIIQEKQNINHSDKNQSKHGGFDRILIDKVSLNSRARVQCREKENNMMSMNNIDLKKNDLRFNRLLLSEDRRNTRSTFKI